MKVDLSVVTTARCFWGCWRQGWHLILHSEIPILNYIHYHKFFLLIEVILKMEFKWTWLFSLAVKPTIRVGVMWDILNNCPKSWISPISLSINKIFKANCLFLHHMNCSKDWTPDFCSSEPQTRLGIKLLCYKICKAFKEMLLHFLLAAAICVWFVIVHLLCWPDGRKCYFQLSVLLMRVPVFLWACRIQAFLPPLYPNQFTI